LAVALVSLLGTLGRDLGSRRILWRDFRSRCFLGRDFGDWTRCFLRSNLRLDLGSNLGPI